MALTFSDPLIWPPQRPRTDPRARSFNNGFRRDLRFEDMIGYLEEELSALSVVERPTLHTDMEHINVPRLRKKLSDDSGVCLEITIRKKIYYLTCDQWYLIEHNLYALHLMLRALRNTSGWINVDFARLIYGFREDQEDASAPPPPEEDPHLLEEWRLVLGLGPTATLDDAHAVYRRRMKQAVQDEDAMLKLNLAMDAAKRELLMD